MPDVHLPEWLNLQYDYIKRCLDSRRLPHALLFEGSVGLGKRFFSAHCALTMLLESDFNFDQWNEQQVIGYAHPDFMWVTLPEKGKSISVDEIRKLKSFLSEKPQYVEHKVAVIAYADKMTIQASNALLKILEEPLVNTYIILVSDERRSILPTILSRCQTVHFRVTKPEGIQAWVRQELSDEKIKEEQEEKVSMLIDHYVNAPYLCLSHCRSYLKKPASVFIYQDFLKLLTKLTCGYANLGEFLTMCKKFDVADIIDNWMKAVHDAVVRKVSKHTRFSDGDQFTLNVNANSMEWYSFWDELFEAKHKVQRVSMLNSELLLFQLTRRWIELFKSEERI